MTNAALATTVRENDDNLGIIRLSRKDERACGLSKGKYTGLGWTEHYDLINWINLLIHMHPEAEIVLYGISTGANAIMNASGDFMPKNVKCGIVDSGYVYELVN